MSYPRPRQHLHSSDVWMHWLTCCVTPQAPQKRPRIDRSMIGDPTDFVHLSHVGANDMQQDHGYLRRLETQMCSKGQYDAPAPSALPALRALS